MMFAIYKCFELRSSVVLIAVFVASAIDAYPAVAGSERLAHALVVNVTQPPLGWVAFCLRQPAECSTTTPAPRELVLSRNQAWRNLVRVNKWVNQTIKPMSDREHWGVVEHWSYPDDGYGDCEDYVLLKRRMLIQSGLPHAALLVTLVRDTKDEGHAVLTVLTDNGDYILDNHTKDILLWSETGYRFVKRQSQSNPNEWVSLGALHPTIARASGRSFATGHAPYWLRESGTDTSREGALRSWAWGSHR
jgi:predicted transglutaminase-like cysteine proteinase